MISITKQGSFSVPEILNHAQQPILISPRVRTTVENLAYRKEPLHRAKENHDDHQEVQLITDITASSIEYMCASHHQVSEVLCCRKGKKKKKKKVFQIEHSKFRGV